MVHLGKAGVCIVRREAFINGRAVPLSCRAFDVLELLLAAPNQVVTKRQFIDAVWPEADVEENNIAVQIHALRKVLEIDRKMLETVQRRGYRLNMQP
jgi:DNA-binding winged helix-turn-helix (wHTH) protein